MVYSHYPSGNMESRSCLKKNKNNKKGGREREERPFVSLIGKENFQYEKRQYKGNPDRECSDWWR